MRVLYSALTILLIIFFSPLPPDTYGQEQNVDQTSTGYQHPLPVLKDPKLKVEIAADGLTVPTGIAFLDKDNILVLKRYSGTYEDPLGGVTTVNLVKNGQLQEKPVLKVLSGICDFKNPPPGCGTYNERGLLGITSRIINNTNSTLAGNVDVFLYYTEITLTGQILGNRVYKYLWDGNRLINPTLILDLPASPGPGHNGGKVLIGPDGFLYTVIGDQDQDPFYYSADIYPGAQRSGQLQNIKDGGIPDNTSVILRVNPENGLPAPGNPFISNATINKGTFDSGNATGLNRYYAYGIRNSFGLAFDPVTGNLWDTENGKGQYDEINLVNPGFNSGWRTVMGPILRTNVTEEELVNFPGSKYSDPKFSWNQTIGVTDLEFFNSTELGTNYSNNLFVGDYNTGSLYLFKINKNRDGIEFNENQTDLLDHVADDSVERAKNVLGTGFDIITDIKTGPDGYLYIVSYSEYSKSHIPNVSRIYRIVPS